MTFNWPDTIVYHLQDYINLPIILVDLESFKASSFISNGP